MRDIEVLDSINNIYEQLYDKISMEMFGVPFSGLQEEAILKVSERLKKNLKILEPAY